MNILLLGPPGSGKGTQAGWLAERWGLGLLSAGDLLRRAVTLQTPQGRLLGGYLTRGELAPHQLVIDIMFEHLRQGAASQKGWVLDGFPRSLEQAHALQAAHFSIDWLLHFCLSEAEILKRLGGRRVHPASGRVYHVTANPPRQPDRDDITGDSLVIRKDDTPAVIRHRLEVYQQETEPLLEFYRSISVPEIEINASLSIEVVRHILGDLPLPPWMR